MVKRGNARGIKDTVYQGILKSLAPVFDSFLLPISSKIIHFYKLTNINSDKNIPQVG